MRLRLDTTVTVRAGPRGSLRDSTRTTDKSPVQHLPAQGAAAGPDRHPGNAAIHAALHPATGNWLYFVTTDPSTGTPSSATTDAEFPALKRSSTRTCNGSPPVTMVCGCAVLGHPIAHSLSPVLHRAAYAGAGPGRLVLPGDRVRRGAASPAALARAVGRAVADHAAQAGRAAAARRGRTAGAAVGAANTVVFPRPAGSATTPTCTGSSWR